MAAERISAVGLALSCPAMSGAEPCTASNTAYSLPMFAPGAMPKPPAMPAAKSLAMSPYRLGNTTTSNWDGSITRFMQNASIMRSSNATRPSYSAATSRATRRNRPSEYFMMLALWAAVTFRRPCASAYSNA